MSLLFKHIKELLQVRENSPAFIGGENMKKLPTLSDAYLLLQDGIIKDFGAMADMPPNLIADEVIDATGKMILPTWCDSHTHIVFAGNRETEFIDRINGLSYEEIAQRGGGILNSAKKLRETSEEELYLQSKTRLEEVMALGTGAIEIKSGYGLDPDSELKMLRVIKRLAREFPLPVKATYLAAHALPVSYKNNKSAYLKIIVDEVIPVIAEENLATFIDVFCETGYFSVEDTELLLKAGSRYGLIPKVHVNQFTAIGGVMAAVKHQAISVDHLEILNPEDIEALSVSSTMPTALPACSFFLGIPYTPARSLIDAGLPVALASDYNPGSAPTGNMNFVVASACIKMNMTPEEAINAATVNSAYAMGLENEVGSITIGKKANVILTKPLNSYGVLPYAFGTNHIDQVFLAGNKWLSA